MMTGTHAMFVLDSNSINVNDSACLHASEETFLVTDATGNSYHFIWRYTV